MTRRREFETHRRKLTEIREIMSSMKTLAYMETHKLARFIHAQHALVDNIGDIARDFLAFHSDILPEVEPGTDIILLVGSERGFCGNFNEIFLEHLQLTLPYHQQRNTTLIAIGHKLQLLLESPPLETIYLQGANIAEEISNVVSNLSLTLTSRQDLPVSLYALYHAGGDCSIVSERLLPPFQHTHAVNTDLTYPPVLNLTPQAFFLELTEHYLFSELHRILYVSLMTENKKRIEHLENAVSHLDNQTNELLLKSNALRQEEIIEEIEVILLNTSINV